MNNLIEYKERIEEEIQKFVRGEIDNPEGLSMPAEEYLHILFENHKHAKEFMHEKEAHHSHTAPTAPITHDPSMRKIT